MGGSGLGKPGEAAAGGSRPWRVVWIAERACGGFLVVGVAEVVAESVVGSEAGLADRRG